MNNNDKLQERIDELEIRVREKTKRNRMVAFRLEPEDYLGLLLIAETEGLNKSEALRMLVKEGVKLLSASPSPSE